MEKCLHILPLASIIGCQLFNSIPVNAQREKPNLVLFMADDCSYYDLGCNGSADSKTPNIDKFATQGINFTKVISKINEKGKQALNRNAKSPK